ncbi:MAG: hypothetical protein KDD60_05605, partial [Bdellovibrionales bacterium]|nr:hypothetical protein [Bdellovibrionales bacterium]
MRNLYVLSFFLLSSICSGYADDDVSKNPASVISHSVEVDSATEKLQRIKQMTHSDKVEVSKA